MKEEIILLNEKFRNQAIELVNQFFNQVNSMKLDGLFKIKPRAATKMLDIYFKLQGSGKVLLAGYVIENELVAIIIAKSEERPYLEEEKILYIDLAVTKKGKMKKGYMKKLLSFTENWAKKNNYKIIELRVLNENIEALKYWDIRGFKNFYSRFRKQL